MVMESSNVAREQGHGLLRRELSVVSSLCFLLNKSVFRLSMKLILFYLPYGMKVDVGILHVDDLEEFWDFGNWCVSPFLFLISWCLPMAILAL